MLCPLLPAALQVAAFQCLQPFVGTLLAFLVLGEEPTGVSGGGCRCVVWVAGCCR